AEVRLYGPLFLDEDPESEEGADSIDRLNADSLKRLVSCRLEPGFKKAGTGNRYQFIRHGYFCIDNILAKSKAIVFNRIVPLKDTWAKLKKSK
ncbi:MAG: glutamine--tRNA ligase, partial [Firmicutes bacterium]|nr:glutamine--tRNA ligase [Bacillota bacterium]